MKKLWILLVLAIGMWSCNGAGDESEATGETDTTEASEAGNRAADNSKAAMDAYKITPFTASTSYPDAKLEYVSFENGEWTFNVSGESYELGVQTPDADQKNCANSAEGQHIHLIIDTEPYAAKYEPSFEYTMEDGGHHVLAFLSRSYHESIKTKDAHVAFFAKVQDGNLRGTGPLEDPILFYSRPKGIYSGKDAEKIMLDYYMVNTEGGGYTVQADINGQTFKFDEWIPRYIEGLPSGENIIRLTLLDKNGNPVNNPLNPVERKFVVNREPVEN